MIKITPTSLQPIATEAAPSKIYARKIGITMSAASLAIITYFAVEKIGKWRQDQLLQERQKEQIREWNFFKNCQSTSFLSHPECDKNPHPYNCYREYAEMGQPRSMQKVRELGEKQKIDISPVEASYKYMYDMQFECQKEVAERTNDWSVLGRFYEEVEGQFDKAFDYYAIDAKYGKDESMQQLSRINDKLSNKRDLTEIEAVYDLAHKLRELRRWSNLSHIFEKKKKYFHALCSYMKASDVASSANTNGSYAIAIERVKKEANIKEDDIPGIRKICDIPPSQLAQWQYNEAYAL